MFGKSLEKIQKNVFIKNVLVLLSGNVLGYIINILSLPLIGRVFSPADMGEYDLILSTGRFVMNFSSLGLIIAIMLPKDDEDAKRLCKLILLLNVSIISTLLIFFVAIGNVFQLFSTTIPYYMALFLLGLYIVSYNMQELFYSYMNRKKIYKGLFWNPLILAVSNVGISLVLGFCGFGTFGYLMGTILSYIVSILYMRIYVSPFSEKISFNSCKAILLEYKDIVNVQMPANFITQVGNEIPIQYLGRIFGAVMLGGYSMANKLLSIAIGVLSTPVNRVVYQELSEKVNKKEPVGDFLFGILEKNIKLALIPVGAMIIIGGKIVPWILGKEWIAAGEYIAVLGSMYLLKFCSNCVSGTFVVMQHQKLSLWMSFVNIIKYVFCFGIAYILKFDVMSTIIIYAVVECIYQLLNLALCVYCTDYSIKRFLWFVFKYIVGGNILIYGIYALVKVFN